MTLVTAAALVALTVFALLLPELSSRALAQPARLATFTVVALFLQFVTVEIYKRGAYSFASCGLMALGFAVSPGAAMLVAVLAGTIRLLRSHGKLYRAVYDASQLALAGGLSALVMHAFPSSGAVAQVPATFLAGAVFYVVNVGMLSYAMSLEEGSSPLAVWRERFQWMWPYTIASGPLAGGLLLAYDRVGIAGVAIFTVPPVFMMISVKQYVSKTEENVEEIRKINQRLAASEEHFRSLIEDASDAIAVLGPYGDITYGSPALERLLDRPLVELLGQRALHLLAPERRHQVVESLRSHLAGSGQPFELRLPGDDEDEQILEVLARRGEDEGGLVITVRDVTARRQAEEERAKLEDALQHSQRIEAVGRLAGGVAHDFNNLLTVIMGCSEFLLLQMDEDDARRAEAEEITRAAARAAALTRQLLAFSRKQVLEPRPLDLNSIVCDLEKMLGRLIGADIRLETQPSSSSAPVFADPGQLEQVIVNLVVNAKDAIGEHPGRIEVAVRDAGPDEALPAELEDGRRYVVLSVSDTGSGMDEETMAKVFEPFFTTKEVGKGTGLGLSTVYGIVKQSEGAVAIDSELGRGSTFNVYIPRHDGPVELVEARPKPTAEVKSATILVVDDEDAVRRFASTVLEDQGHRVLTARNGIDALELARAYNRSIDLLLTDIVMPEMTGHALAQQLAIERPQLKALYMSGHVGSVELDENSPQLLQKPFSGTTLVETVQLILQDPAAGFPSTGAAQAPQASPAA